MQKIDEYYNEIKEKYDEILKETEEYASKSKDKIEQTIRDELADEIDAAKQESKKIIEDAEESVAGLRSDLEGKIAECDAKNQDLTKKMVEAEYKLIEYKGQAYEEIRTEIDALRQEKDESRAEAKELLRKNKDLENEKELLESDLEAYRKIANGIKDLKEYKLETEYRLEDQAYIIKTQKTKLDEIRQEVERLRSIIEQYGEDPTELMGRIDTQKKEIQRLEDKLACYPSEAEIEVLRKTAKEYEQLQDQHSELKSEKDIIERERNDLRLNHDDVENYRRFIKILELQKTELQNELDRTISLHNSKAELVFPSLSKIDGEPVKQLQSKPMGLKEFCNNFRLYLETRNNNPLYYDEITIRTFVAGFASSRLMILEGLSGTGKSSLPQAFKDFIGAEVDFIPVQSSWKDRNDLLGFYNDFKQQYKETAFLKALYSATHDSEKIHCIVLDEMNLSRIEYYFADLLSVLERPNPDEWDIELISDHAGVRGNTESWPKLIHEGKLRILENTWFIGTANKDDSTFTITDKVYDRAVVINFESKGVKSSTSGSKPHVNYMDLATFNKMLDSGRGWRSDDKMKFDKIVKTLDDMISNRFQITFGNRIANQLTHFVPVYVSCGGTVDEAVDIMFCRKILRKLDGYYDESTKEGLQQLRDLIKSEKFNMPKTLEQINRMESRI